MNDDLDTRILPADLVTPVGAYLRLREALGAPAFLLESVERGEQVGRYSFLGAGLPAVDSLAEAAAFAATRPGPGAGPAAVPGRRGRLPELRLGDRARAGAAAGRRPPPTPGCR